MTPIYDAKNFDVCNSLGYLMSRVRVEIIDAVDRELAPFDITTAQYVVIMLLANGVATKASEICKTISHDPGAMTRLLDHLEAKGLVRRVRTPGDRRAARLELTPEGRAVYPQILEKAVGVLNRFLRGLTKTEVHRTEAFLKRMLANA